MKVRATLGITDKEAWAKSKRCAELGYGAARVKSAIQYAEYELKKPHVRVDVEDISAGLYRVRQGWPKISPER